MSSIDGLAVVSVCYSEHMKINYVTTNKMKFDIAKAYFDKLGSTHELVQYMIDTPEIQDESVEEIARQSAVWAANETGEVCIKMDVGFFINALNGFPGPFVKYVNDWLTQEDILAMMAEKSDRSVYFQDALAVGFPDGTAEVFSLKSKGLLATTANPDDVKWPTNLLFIPDGHDRSLGALSMDEQHAYWGDGNWPALIRHLEATMHDRS